MMAVFFLTLLSHNESGALSSALPGDLSDVYNNLIYKLICLNKYISY